MRDGTCSVKSWAQGQLPRCVLCSETVWPKRRVTGNHESFQNQFKKFDSLFKINHTSKKKSFFLLVTKETTHFP